MTRTVYIQALDQFPIDKPGVDALLGFKQMGVATKFYETIDQVPLHPSVLVVGFADDVRYWLMAMGIPMPGSITLPKQLHYYAGRAIQQTTLEQALIQTEYPYFIKPTLHKLFEARIIEQPSDLIDIVNTVPLSTEALTSIPVTFTSEYRGVIIEGKFVGLKHYKGNLCLFPSCEIINRVIRDFTEQPLAFSIDFGLDSLGRTLLVECNDFWSLDSFGLDPKLYAEGLLLRWNEILKGAA
ncbi:ATP-grasp domain-containing protein [Spirosoma luteum]|uniref:ATP-grasp domain-containing protein n=1 Tax=Spirosoma luteum TaxID=431553 RepID=UPI00037BEF47|nr:ATP-grasp domain-containing protein [Spirosoma luteum]